MTFTIYDSLLCGKDHAINAKTLCDIHGFKDSRQLRHQITEERLNGAFIAANENGYFRPVTISEFRECWKWFHTRAVHSFKIAKIFRNAIRDQFEGQQSLFDLQEDEELDRFFMGESNDD